MHDQLEASASDSPFSFPLPSRSSPFPAHFRRHWHTEQLHPTLRFPISGEWFRKLVNLSYLLRGTLFNYEPISFHYISLQHSTTYEERNVKDCTCSFIITCRDTIYIRLDVMHSYSWDVLSPPDSKPSESSWSSQWQLHCSSTIQSQTDLTYAHSRGTDVCLVISDGLRRYYPPPLLGGTGSSLVKSHGFSPLP